MTNFTNKVALVTGSARGLSKAIAERLGSLGATVSVNYSSDEANAMHTVEKIKAS
jgi:3-oxoacyl-[acyl-carrier protein] reductase